VLAHFNTSDEPGRTTVCDSTTISKSYLFDKPGDTIGGANFGIDFAANVFSRAGTAVYGSAYSLDKRALIE